MHEHASMYLYVYDDNAWSSFVDSLYLIGDNGNLSLTPVLIFLFNKRQNNTLVSVLTIHSYTYIDIYVQRHTVVADLFSA